MLIGQRGKLPRKMALPGGQGFVQKLEASGVGGRISTDIRGAGIGLRRERLKRQAIGRRLAT